MPDTPDRTDAIARVLVSAIRDHTGITKPNLVMWNYDVVKAADIEAGALLTTDDPAAIAALAATLAERHPDALLDALTTVGVPVTLHLRGFSDAKRMVSGVSAAVVPGKVVDVANGTLDAMREHPKPRDIQVSSVRTFDGWLREVEAIVTIEGHEDRPMWHRFVEPGEQWLIKQKVTDG